MSINNVCVLLSTMNNKIPLFLKKNSGVSVVINQTKDLNFVGFNNIAFHNFNEKGLSKSRNRAILLANSKYCCIADDDIYYVDDYKEKIIKSFDAIPDADVLVFQIYTPEGLPYKKYKNYIFKMNKFSIMKVSSIEIIFNREAILSKNIRFDESFGLGSLFKSGEENIFLADCLKNGLNIYAVNENLVFHPFESSGKIINDNFFYDRGAVFFRIYGFFIANLLYFYFSFKKSKNKRQALSNLILMYKGLFRYLKVSK
ncbi:glycosyltransferase [Acinetobacter baumannii]|nr:glycosyltransferase [Acinetobacter baumannii]